MELVAELPGHLISGLALDAQGELFAICASSGELLRLDKSRNAFVSVLATESSPHGIAIDARSGDLYLSDPSEGAIFRYAPGGEEALARYLSAVDGRPFVGPAALALAPDGELFFTDAGREGDSSVADPVGAVYRTLQGRSQVVPLCARGLVRPAAIALSAEGAVFVGEQGANRVWRFVPRGTYYVGGVFAHLHGGVGPVAVAVRPNDGSVFVAQLDWPAPGVAEEAEGVIHVFGRDGEGRGEVRTPNAALAAMVFDAAGENLFVAEAKEETGMSRLYRFHIPPA